MAYQEVFRVDTAELIRLWQKGLSQRRIAMISGRARDTVRRYVSAARELGLEPGGPDPTEEQLARLAALNLSAPATALTPAADVLEPHTEQIGRWLKRDKLQLTRIHELLAQRGISVSYSSLRRFCNRRDLRTKRGRSTIRMQDPDPGQVAELDFGNLGKIFCPDAGRQRTVHALVLVMAYSRHMFVWPLFSQRLEDVVEGLERAWGFFGGIPQFLVIDNFPASVAGDDRYKPRLTRGFLEYAQHRGFVPDPARSYHPQDKPRVERGISYVRERFFKGSRFTGIEDMRSRARDWCTRVAGQRTHGTIRRQPLAVFTGEERTCLSGFDGEPYEVGHWHTAKVGRDHHVQAKYGLYSVPQHLDLQGKQVEISIDRSLARIYYRGALIKVHPRQARGQRITDPQDLPEQLRVYASRDPEAVRRKARQIGKATAFYANTLLGKKTTWARLRSGHSLIKLGERFGPWALEKACRQAIAVDLYDIKRLRTILLAAIERDGEEKIDDPPAPGRYARPGRVFAIGNGDGAGNGRER